VSRESFHLLSNLLSFRHQTGFFNPGSCRLVIAGCDLDFCLSLIQTEGLSLELNLSFRNLYLCLFYPQNRLIQARFLKLLNRSDLKNLSLKRLCSRFCREKDQLALNGPLLRVTHSKNCLTHLYFHRALIVVTAAAALGLTLLQSFLDCAEIPVCPREQSLFLYQVLACELVSLLLGLLYYALDFCAIAKILFPLRLA